MSHKNTRRNFADDTGLLIVSKEEEWKKCAAFSNTHTTQYSGFMMSVNLKLGNHKISTGTSSTELCSYKFNFNDVPKKLITRDKYKLVFPLLRSSKINIYYLILNLPLIFLINQYYRFFRYFHPFLTWMRPVSQTPSTSSQPSRKRLSH